MTSNNVTSTSVRRHDVAPTLARRCSKVVCLLGKDHEKPQFYSEKYNEVDIVNKLVHRLASNDFVSWNEICRHSI